MADLSARPTTEPSDVTADDIELLAINTVRTLAMDAVQAADSGHPGMPMGAAPMGYVLFRDAMRYDPAHPDWPDRDRFVLSAGHGSMFLYAYLHLVGYDLSLEDIRNFRQWASPTAGHPEHSVAPGVETTTGPLGQGFANAVGMALAEAKLAAEFNRDGHVVVDHRTYAVVSDGDLMEGVTNEAASLAGHLKLGKLIMLYDDNSITIDGDTNQTFTEDVVARFGALGWHTDRVEDGNDLDALRRAVKAAEADERPSLIAVRTVIGYGSPNLAGSAATHGQALGEAEVAATKTALGWAREDPFTVPDEVRRHLDARERGQQAHDSWQRRMDAYHEAFPEQADELERRLRGELPDGWRQATPTLDGDMATRKASGKALDAYSAVLPELFGGSADLAGSNVSEIEGSGVFGPVNRLGRNLRFGVREHAMGSVCNGIALHGGFIPYGATFLIFTDYARPALRLSALMEQRVIWIMTHDSIGLGEDGPTHQPIEHLASLRAMPNMHVIRPADAGETVQAWTAAVSREDGPTVLALTRQTLPDLGDKPSDAVERGAYVLRDPDGEPDVILIATGSEVQHAVAAVELLEAEDVAVRVVSMPCWERFAAQDADYREEVLPSAVPARVSIEAGATFGWERWVGTGGTAIGIDRFGASAPGDRLMREFGFTAEHVAEVARDVLAR
ncbi:MAG: transketolase [Actinobacteria bacterium]|nr:transketolase [Actinomycetota bacterium]